MKTNIERALIIGINDYPGAPLDGCVNDAKIWTSLLKQAGTDVRLVTNGEATAERMYSEICDIANAQSPYAIIYAGHGSQIFNESSEDEDMIDECLCPVDFDGGREHAIVAKDMKAWLSTEQECLLVIDACHSGTMISQLCEVYGAGWGLSRQVRSWPWPLSPRSSSAETNTFVAEMSEHPNVVLLAACDEHESALERDLPVWDCIPWWRRSGGLWSYYLTRTIKWIDSVSDTYRFSTFALFQAASTLLSIDYSLQHPQYQSRGSSGDVISFWRG
jgi:hypothetical protein